jgi:LemA protein
MKQQGNISIGTIVLLVIGAGISLYLVSVYNGLVTQNQAVNSSWAQVQSQYQRRMDLIPNLVSTVKGEANFEKSTLIDVINARANATKITLSPELLNNPEQFSQFQKTQGELGSTLSRLMVTIEKYPELKTNQQFAQLMDEISGTENRIAVARRDFNNIVQVYDTSIAKFPTNLFANQFGFKHKEYFQAEAGASQAPKVEFQ